MQGHPHRARELGEALSLDSNRGGSPGRTGKGAGTQWDPEVVKVFLKLRRSGTKRKGKGKREREQWYHRLADGFDCHYCPTTLR